MRVAPPRVAPDRRRRGVGILSACVALVTASVVTGGPASADPGDVDEVVAQFPTKAAGSAG
jgi:hypothetical protein